MKCKNCGILYDMDDYEHGDSGTGKCVSCAKNEQWLKIPIVALHLLKKTCKKQLLFARLFRTLFVSVNDKSVSILPYHHKHHRSQDFSIHFMN